jgi:hypothetical protein
MVSVVDIESLLLQRSVCLALKLKGFAVVAVVCSGAGVSGVGAACEHQLAVVWAQGPPEPLNNTQQLAYMVSTAHSVLTPHSVLKPHCTILGFILQIFRLSGTCLHLCNSQFILWGS